MKPQDFERIKGETKILSLLAHPNIISHIEVIYKEKTRN